MTNVKETLLRIAGGSALVGSVGVAAYTYGENNMLKQGVLSGDARVLASQAQTAPTATEAPRPAPTATATVVNAEATKAAAPLAVATPTPLTAEALKASVDAAVATKTAPWATEVADLKKQLEALKPTATPDAQMREIAPSVRLGAGWLDKPNNTVDVVRADRGFKNAIGLGTDAFLSEPGGLLVGPDYESKATDKNPMGANPQGWGAMYNGKGHIVPFSPDTQQAQVSKGSENVLLVSEGGWGHISAPYVTFDLEGIPDSRVELKPEKGLNYFVFVRGFYGDSQQDTPRNIRLMYRDFMTGATLQERLPGGKDENTAFWSEGQFRQKVVTSHSEKSNCGDGGCSRLRVLYIDPNTRAWALLEQTAPRNLSQETAGQGWKVIAKNY
jgi:hypothetical protein